MEGNTYLCYFCTTSKYQLLILQLWFLTWLVVLRGDVSVEVWNHLCYLTIGFVILLEDEISPASLTIAEQSIYYFVSNHESVFGPEFCSFNVHLLVHATDCVRWWGPLW